MHDQAFPRTRRLGKRAEFRRTYDEGKKLAGRHLVLFFRSTEARGLRLGLTVTRHVGNSVVRNRIRRRLREIYRREVRQILDGNRWFCADLVVNVRPGATGVDLDALAEDFTRLARRVGERAE
jgi:ribonuclease P protein component